MNNCREIFMKAIEKARNEGACRLDENIPDDDKEEAYRLGANDMLDDLFEIFDSLLSEK